MKNLKAIVMSASCTPSVKCWGKYKRVAVLVVDLDVLAAEGRELPAMISRHARGVVRIAGVWEKLNVGLTSRCAYQRALAEAETLAAEINAELEKVG